MLVQVHTFVVSSYIRKRVQTLKESIVLGDILPVNV